MRYYTLFFLLFLLFPSFVCDIQLIFDILGKYWCECMFAGQEMLQWRESHLLLLGLFPIIGDYISDRFLLVIVCVCISIMLKDAATVNMVILHEMMHLSYQAITHLYPLIPIHLPLLPDLGLLIFLQSCILFYLHVFLYWAQCLM